MTETIYKVDPSCEEDRPIVDEAVWHSEHDWDEQWKFFTRQTEWPDYHAPKLLSIHPHAPDWDYYVYWIGLLPKRARGVLEPYAKEYFEFLDASLNGKPYFLLRIKRPLAGVLNYDECEFDFLDDGLTPRSIRKCV